MTSTNDLDVVCVGGCFMDMMVYADRLPVAGETINGTDFKILCGGKGSNICVMAALLGARCAMVARVGKDNNGAETKANFKTFGVNTDFLIETENESTGVTTCYVDCAGEPAFVSIAGANYLLCPADVDTAENLLSSAKVLVCPKAMKDLRTFLRAFQLAKKHGLTTIFNIAPAVSQPLDPEFYKVVDIVIVNMLETERLTGVKVASSEDAEKALAIMHDRGIEKAAITLGKDGAYCSEKVGDEIVYEKVSAPVIEDVVDCTGSGDAFTGAVAYYLSTHPSLTFKDIVQRSVHIASETVRKKGCQRSYPSRHELNNQLFM